MSRYVIRGGREGYDRLKVLARARWLTTSALLQRARIRPGMRCLDLGCGGGDVTLEMARITETHGHVVGIDLDEVKLALARTEASERGVVNIEFRTQDATTWNEPDSYDLVYSRFLLEHLPDPLELVRQMWAAVKKGGGLAVEVTDFSGLFCEPTNRGFEFHSRMYPLTVERFGGDALLGRKLYRLLLKAHVPEPQLHLFQTADTAGEAKHLALLTLQATAESILDGGFATRPEIDSAIDDLRAFTEDPTTIVGSPRIFQAWAFRE